MADALNNIQTLYLKIKEAIINLDFKPGDRLAERELAKKYNVSRTPIRQVIQKLSVEGLVEIIPYKGAFIKQLTIDDFKDITQLRNILETFSVKGCCENHDETVIIQLKEIIQKQKNAVEIEDVKEYSLLDQEFHFTIVKASGNKELIHFVELLNQKSYLSRIRTLSLPDQMEKSLAEHQEIFKCIVNKDKSMAAKKATEHVENALQRYISLQNMIENFS